MDECLFLVNIKALSHSIIKALNHSNTISFLQKPYICSSIPSIQDMKKQIPNLITSLNLLCGIMAIYFSFMGNLQLAAALMALGAFFDFFDGLAARALNVKSEMGKQMDSLADLVSFGLVPGFIMFQLMRTSPDMPQIMIGTALISPFLAFIIPILSAYRLAKFNIDTRQTDSFIGLPTPALALFVGSLPFLLEGFWSIQLAWLNSYYILLFLSFGLSILLVSELPLFSLKFKNLKWKDNSIRFIFLGLSLISLLMLQLGAFPIIIILYVLLSLIHRK